jgi:hypothetical protein
MIIGGVFLNKKLLVRKMEIAIKILKKERRENKKKKKINDIKLG